MEAIPETVALCGGRVVLPDRVLAPAGVLLRGGRIAAVGTFAVPAGARVIDAAGGLILAGFIDVHLHGGGGSDFMDGTPESLRRIARTHCLHGTTAMAPTTLSCPYEEMQRFFALYRDAAAQSDTAELLGIHLEGPYISQQMRGAQNPAWIRSPTPAETERLLHDGEGLLARCSCAPEAEGVPALAAALREAGVLLAVGHSNATCEQTLAAWEQGFRHVTHLYCATPGIRKIGQHVHGGVVEAAYLLDDMTVELIGDGCHVPPEVIRLAVKCKGPDRVLLITDAMRAAGTEVKESFLGTDRPENRVIIEDGVAKLPDRSSFAGSIATMDAVFRNARQAVGLPLPVITRLMSLNPARHLGVEGRKGSLAVGKDADVLVLDAQDRIAHVFARGREIT